MLLKVPSLTAQGVAWFRAATGVDPYAERFLWPAVRRTLGAWPVIRRLDALDTGRAVMGRHGFIDAVLRQVRPPQVVLLGAGYDSRPWRLGLDARWFLVDHPATAGRRARIAAALPNVNAVRVDVDFAREDFVARLLATGFQPERPSVFVWEGVSMYLPEPAVRSTLAQVAQLSDTLAMDFWIGAGTLSERLGRKLVAAVGEPLRYAPTRPQAESLLADAGWQIDAFAPAIRGNSLWVGRFSRDGQ